MADHIDENGEASENRNLDQSAIDEAVAAMQVEDSADTAAEIVTAAHSNGGETFAASESDGQEDLDAAIAALQADATSAEEAAVAEPTESGEASQKDIDAALATMQADATSAEEAAEAEPTESGDASQKDIDAEFAAAQADAIPEEVTETESAESGDASQTDIDATMVAVQNDDYGEANAEKTAETGAEDASQDDINAAIAAMQKDGSDGVETEENAEIESAEAGQEDLDEAIGARQNDGTEESAETETSVDKVTPVAETERNVLGTNQEALSDDAYKVDDAKDIDDVNTFSGLDEEELADNKPIQDAPGESGLNELKAAPGGHGDFSGLDEDKSELEAAIASKEQVSDGFADSQAATVAESLPEVTEKLSDSPKTNAAKKPRGLGKKRIGIGALCLMVLVGSTAYFGRDFYSAYKAKTLTPAAEAPIVAAAPVKTGTPQPQPTASQNPYHEKLQEVSRLRADLLSKKDEIDRLRQFYRDGISELEEELQQEVTKQGVQKLSQAMANHKIELDLQSIQRRWAYIDELAKPYHWLQQGSEELLFLSRRTEIDLQMDAIADGIELTKHMRRLNASMQKYQLSPERLAIDVSNSRLRPVEEIWQAISAQNKAIAQKAVANGDQAIIDEICSGDTGRMAELTTLTIKASKCLSQLDASELFLNRLTSLSPVAAKYLSSWKGQWLCLNGFQEMTPDVARHLFRWEGNWISLNGLEDFNPQIAELLLAWEGEQLELMGLVYKADQAEKVGLQQLSDWERAGGKLFVPEPIRVEMEKLK